MAFGTKKRKQQKQQESELQKQMVAGMQAWKPSPLEEQQNARVTKFLGDWDSGKDVSEIDYLRPYFNLYNNAAAESPDLSGVGLLGNNQLAGGNGMLAGLIGQQFRARQQQQAAGQLYNAANAAHADATGGQIPFLVGTEQSRMAGKAGQSAQNYFSFLNRPKSTPFWQTLLLGGVKAAGEAASSAAAAGA